MDIETKVSNIIKSKIEDIGLKLHEVKYEKEDNIYYLRIIIDKDGYVNIKDCIDVNRVIDPILEDIDFIEESYILDVCSRTREED